MTHKIHEFNCSTKQHVIRDATSAEVALADRDAQEGKQRKIEEQIAYKEKLALIQKAAGAMGLTVAEYLTLFPIADIKDME